MKKSNRQCGCIARPNPCPTCAKRLQKWIEWKIVNKKLMDQRDAKERENE